VTISVDVTNIGGMDGDEVVQLYLSHADAAGAPIRALTGFQRVHLARGQKQRVQFTLQDRELSIVDPDGVRRIAPGEVHVWVGGGQQGARSAAGVETRFQIVSGATLAN
jgi:beta-glucosidase